MYEKRIRTAVFPVGGLGTRFLPATKSMPKEMLTVIDKPLIQYAVEEAVDAGIDQFIFVTGRGKRAIEDHFDNSYELNTALQKQKKDGPYQLAQQMVFEPGRICYLRQQDPLGLGHAVWCARKLIQDEPFAVILADDLILSPQGCLRQMVEAYEGGNMVAVQEVPEDRVSDYGILDVSHSVGPFRYARTIVEKPAQADAPSRTAVIGRYILEPGIFSVLEALPKSVSGEIQLTDALRAMLPESTLTGYAFRGRRFDCGSKVGLLQANIAYALVRPDMQEAVYSLVRDIAAGGGRL